MTKLTTISLTGVLGKALRLSCDNRLKKVNYAYMATPFQSQMDVDGAWRCEFWGKVTRSSILTNYWLKDPEFAVIIRKAVDGILATQQSNGCISSYTDDKHTWRWDIWGRKYVLLGLMRYYRLVEQDPKVLDACKALVDHLMTEVGPGKKQMMECGEHGGLAACSILVAIVELYDLTKDKRYLDYAEWIADSGCSVEGNIFRSAIVGAAPATIGNGKAYEMTSCFEGLADLYKFIPKAEYRDGCIAYFKAVCEREIYITGTGGLRDECGEIWYEGTVRQTLPDCGMRGETCVTATWLHYCLKMMELLPDSTVPLQEAERAMYNAMLGAMKPDGSDWCHVNPTLIGGFKLPAADQINRCFNSPFDNHDCCRAQGPEGLACAPYFVVSADASGAVKVNFFEALKADFDNGAHLEIEGDYPYDSEAKVRFTAPETAVLKVRIPQHCKGVRVNGRSVGFIPETYLSLQGSNEVSLEFDLTLKEVSAPADPTYVAYKKGPVVLAEDNRGDVPEARFHETVNGHSLVDYVAAGNLFTRENTLVVWFRK